MPGAFRPLEQPHLLFCIGFAFALGCSSSGGEQCPDGTAAPCATITGSLAITVSGLSTTVPANITVTGPDFTAPVTATATLTLKPGQYTIAAVDVAGAGFRFKAPPDQSVTVTQGGTSGATVPYVFAAPRLHAMAISVPTGVRPPWSLSKSYDIGDFGTAISGDTTVDDLLPGYQAIRAGGILAGNGVLTPEPGFQVFFLGPGTDLKVTVTWHGTTLRDLAPSVNGVGGTPATGLSGAVGGIATFFRIVVPPGASHLRIATGSGTGGADIYCRGGALPVFPDHITAYEEGQEGTEECLIDQPEAGIWYAQVQAGGLGFAGVTVSAEVTKP